MIRTLKKNTKFQVLVIGLIFALSISSSFNSADGQVLPSDIIFDNTRVKIQLKSNGTSEVAIISNVTNRGSSTLNHIDFRVDTRNLHILECAVNHDPSTAETISISNHLVIRVPLALALGPQESVVLSLTILTEDLQENFGICPESDLCLYNMIYYFRPLNEFRNFTFIVSLPPHALLHSDASDPLFPNPISNFTDGTSLMFQWHEDQILTGHERVYIVKYGIPNLTISPVSDVSPNIPIIALLALVSGIAIAIIVERVPTVVRKLRTPTGIQPVGVTQHEQKVLQILRDKGGSCSQREIYEALDMSQSLASMLLSGLEERGLIKRFRDGRENTVHLIES